MLEGEGGMDLAVFFSPSGLSFVLPMLEEAVRGGMRFCALGPTTRAAVEEAGLECFAEAARPEPGGLRDAILEALEKENS